MRSFKGIITRNSNGTIELQPFDNANPPRELAMGAEVDVSFEVLRTAEEVEAANARSKNRPAPQPAAPAAGGRKTAASKE